MFINYTKVCEVILKRGGHWALEWPEGNVYWNSPLVLEFLGKIGSPIYEASATGCAFGLKAKFGQVAGLPMRRAWMIKSNIPILYEVLNKPCCCPRDTNHVQATGSNTVETGKYTLPFVSAIHSMFSRVVTSKIQNQI